MITIFDFDTEKIVNQIKINQLLKIKNKNKKRKKLNLMKI
jgi:hypothetical protein